MTESSNSPAPVWVSGPYSIKRHGVSIANCDSEPVQTPGCIQSHGVLLVVQPDEWTVVQVSENLADHFPIKPDDLLKRSVSLLLGEAGEARLRDFVKNEPTERNPVYVFTLPAEAARAAYDVIVHTIDGFIIVECERAPANDRASDYYGAVQKSVTRLQGAQTLQDFFKIVTDEVQRITGIDRVMVYRFHEDFHGEVVAETKREDLVPFLGLHYPAEDIPWPAREIFKKIWVRPLPDAGAPPMEMIPLVNPLSGKPLTMTHCVLRGASVMYTEYLQNMGVSASLTMSLIVDGELWGLIACQHQTPKSFPYQIRAACEFLAQVASLQLRAVEQRESLEYRLRIEGVHNGILGNAAKEPSFGPLTTSTPNLLDTMDAAGVAIFYGNRWWQLGVTPTDKQLDGLKDWLNQRPEFDSPLRPIFATDALARHWPEAEAFADVGSGLLAISLSRQKHTYILWFRPETLQTVNWGGNPHDKPQIVGPHGPRLTPRKSFEIFSESVKQRALPWKQIEIDSALRLRVLLMETIVSRMEAITELNADLMRTNEELDAFAYVASHDLKEPLRGISKYAHQLLDNMDDQEPRKKLEAVQRLALRMDSLLDSLLHFSRVGRASLTYVNVNLNEVVEDAIEMISSRRQEIPTDIRIPHPLPVAHCDRVRVREIYVNLLSNAMKYNDKSHREIEIGFAKQSDGVIIYHVRDNGIGMEAKHFEVVFKIFKRLHGRDEFGGGSGAGLAIVHRLVSQHRGRVWVESITGKGTAIFFTLQESDSALS